ncbi:MAG: glycosyltransferase [Pseudomonadota bacterium]
MTTYNGQDHLGDQLDSLLGQVDVSVHIYVFDDQSSDGTLAILDLYAASHPDQITVFRNAQNSGGTGLNIFNNLHLVPTEHDFFALADQDDIWLPTKLSQAVATLTQDQTDLYFSDLLAWDGQDTILGTVRKSGSLKALDHLLGGGSAGCTYVLSAPLFTHLKNVLAATDITAIQRISHDWIIYFIARHYSYPVSAAPDALIKYRIHAESQYGGMSLGGIGALRRKASMLRAGFLREQVANALLFAQKGSPERDILLAYQKGPLHRLAILLRHNFSLARSKMRFFSLVVASLLLY